MDLLLAHLVGDYLLQTNWMAINKFNSWKAAVTHGVTYTLPFIFITTSLNALAVICITHILIDKYRLARVFMWLRQSLVGSNELSLADYKLTKKLKNTPEHLLFWLTVIVDNSFHLLINFGAVTHLAS